jgi:hypothetical protein
MPKKKNPPIKLVLGIPLWGQQDSQFWKPLILESAHLWRDNIELLDVLDSKSMSVDNNRNRISHEFLKSRAEYIAWVDTDNDQGLGWVARLIEHKKPIVGGVYFRRDFDKPTPIAYTREADGRYRSIPGYTRGEIIPVDASGMNCMLVHRSVFEKIQGQFQKFLDQNGRMMIVHRDDIEGNVLDSTIDPTDGKVINGQMRTRLRNPPYNPDGPGVFPFFSQEYNRSEDYHFYEAIKRVGEQIYLDTSIECNHHTFAPVNGSHYRAWIHQQRLKGLWQ